MAAPFDVGRGRIEPHGLAETRLSCGGVEWLVGQGRGGFVLGLAGDDLDQVAIGIGQPHHLAAARFGQVLDRSAFVRGKALEILDRLGAEADRQEPGFARFGHVEERPSIATLAIEPATGLESAHPEVFEKAAHGAKIGRGIAHVGDVFDADYAHLRVLSRRFVID